MLSSICQSTAIPCGWHLVRTEESKSHAVFCQMLVAPDNRGIVIRRNFHQPQKIIVRGNQMVQPPLFVPKIDSGFQVFQGSKHPAYGSAAPQSTRPRQNWEFDIESNSKLYLRWMSKSKW